MLLHRKMIGIGVMGLAIMLLCAGSTLGSEAVSQNPDLPVSFEPANNTNTRPNTSKDELPVSYPLITIAEAEALESHQESTYSNFSITFWELGFAPVDWKTLPIIPELSDASREILLNGIANGNNPLAFSTIGDCQSFPPVFMGIFDDPYAYELASDEGYLQETISHFAGSFARESASVNNGFSAANVLSPLWGDSGLCLPNESPLECEFRIHRPIAVFVNLGTNWQPTGDLAHEDYLSEVVAFAIDRGVLPILSTKGDNIEGNHKINEGIAKVAGEYEVPLWNFWWSIQYLPNHGLDGDRDGNYLSVAAWNRRSYSGLRMLHHVLGELMDLQATIQ